jgi:hypothetical protein
MILRVEFAFVAAENGNTKVTESDYLLWLSGKSIVTFVSADPIVYGCFKLVRHDERPLMRDLFGKASRRCEHRQTLEAFKASCHEESSHLQTAYRQIEHGHSTFRATQCFDNELSAVRRQRIERQLNSNSSRLEKSLMPYIQCCQRGILR